MNTSEIAVKKDDYVEIVLRAKVAAVQAVDDGVVILYFHLIDEDQKLGYVPPVYLGTKSAVQSLTTIKPVKPKLDLDALPVGTLIETFEGDRQRILRKVNGGWLGLNGATYSSAVLMADSTEMYELVRKDATA